MASRVQFRLCCPFQNLPESPIEDGRGYPRRCNRLLGMAWQKSKGREWRCQGWGGPALGARMFC
uniref:Uncharacterized protein n=1 Tax=Candidatus Kentrum sp. MB TaxID=2138164 RepID=A0A450X415_9GAMM|nr:MAG: hypothetical protein BECKMB1821G_GA0114241_10073 [Candidatus Kentron sp. MB]